MKIKSVYIKKFKALKDFYVDFNENINVLIGENGLGKTTILEVIYNMVTNNNEIKNDDNFEECRIKVLFTEEELRTIKNISGEEYKEVQDFILGREGFKEDIGINFIQCGGATRVAQLQNWFNKIVYLPTGVNFKKYKVESPKKIEQDISIGSILSSDEMSINLKEYLVNIHYKDLEDMSIGEKPYRVEKFRKLYNSFFDKKEFIGVKDFEPLFRVKATGEVHSSDELSAGEKQIFFRGGSLLQMNLNNSIILIDEPELSLHPEWQQKILDFYKNIGENNQIIIATHSPHIVSSCKRDEVIVLDRKDRNTNL